jgi:hypothetical protein
MRRLMEATLAALFIPTRLPAWHHVYKHRQTLGGSLWVRLDREQQGSAELRDVALAPRAVQNARDGSTRSTVPA